MELWNEPGNVQPVFGRFLKFSTQGGGQDAAPGRWVLPAGGGFGDRFRKRRACPAFGQSADQLLRHFPGGVINGLAFAELEVGVEKYGGGTGHGAFGEEVAGDGFLNHEIHRHEQFQFPCPEIVIAGAAELAPRKVPDRAAQDRIGILGILDLIGAVQLELPYHVVGDKD